MKIFTYILLLNLTLILIPNTSAISFEIIGDLEEIIECNIVLKDHKTNFKRDLTMYPKEQSICKLPFSIKRTIYEILVLVKMKGDCTLFIPEEAVLLQNGNKVIIDTEQGKINIKNGNISASNAAYIEYKSEKVDNNNYHFSIDDDDDYIEAGDLTDLDAFNNDINKIEIHIKNDSVKNKKHTHRKYPYNTKNKRHNRNRK